MPPPASPAISVGRYVAPRITFEPLESRTHLTASNAAGALLDVDGADHSARLAGLAKGVNLAHVFWVPSFNYDLPDWSFRDWPVNDTLNGGRDDAIVDDWADHVHAVLPGREIRKIVGAGFTYVRLPIDVNFLYHMNPDAPDVGATFDRDAARLLSGTVRQLTDAGLTVVLTPFRSDDSFNVVDVQIWNPAWRRALERFWGKFVPYMQQHADDFDPERVVLQPMNEPRLTEFWRAGHFEGDDWVARDLYGIERLRIRAFQEQDPAELTVSADVFVPILDKLVRAIRKADVHGQFTVMTATPIDTRVTFKGGAALGDGIYALPGHRADVTGAFAEGALVAARDYNAVTALTHPGRDALVRTAAGAIDRNVVYATHFYLNGIFSTAQGAYDSPEYALLYPLPLEPPPLRDKSGRVLFIDGTNVPRGDGPNAATRAYAARFERSLAAVRGRLGIDANGDTLAQGKWAGDAYDRDFIRDRRAAIDAGGASDVAGDVRALYLNAIVPALARLFRYDLRDGSPAAIRDAIDGVQRWADTTDLDAAKRGTQRPFVVMDEFGIRAQSWQFWNDTYRRVDPFDGAEADRLAWLKLVRTNLEGTASDNGRTATSLGWGVWEFSGELAITDAETTDGAATYVAGTTGGGVSYDNVVSYRRRLRKEYADALGVKAFSF